MSKSFDRNAGCPGQSKICNLEYVVLGDQQILWFEIPMQYFFLMAMGDTFDELIGETLDDKRIHAFLFAEIVHKLLQIVLQILEDQHQLSVCVDHLAKMNDVGMVELF